MTLVCIDDFSMVGNTVSHSGDLEHVKNTYHDQTLEFLKDFSHWEAFLSRQPIGLIPFLLELHKA